MKEMISITDHLELHIRFGDEMPSFPVFQSLEAAKRYVLPIIERAQHLLESRRDSKHHAVFVSGAIVVLAAIHAHIDNRKLAQGTEGAAIKGAIRQHSENLGRVRLSAKEAQVEVEMQIHRLNTGRVLYRLMPLFFLAIAVPVWFGVAVPGDTAHIEAAPYHL